MKYCGAPGGLHIAMDGGEVGPCKVECSRAKIFNKIWCICMSTAIRIHYNQYDPSRVTSNETGEGLAENKIFALQDVGISKEEASYLLLEASADSLHHSEIWNIHLLLRSVMTQIQHN